MHETQIRSAYPFLRLDSLVFTPPKLLYKKSLLGMAEVYRGMCAACRLMVWQSHHSFYIRVASAASLSTTHKNQKYGWMIVHGMLRQHWNTQPFIQLLRTKCVSTREFEVAEEGEQSEETNKKRRKMKQIQSQNTYFLVWCECAA